MVDALDIHVKGIVQGVGFRPFVYRLAKRYLINGWVMNTSDGVHIRAEGESDLLDQFVLEISENAPAAARVSEIDLKEVPLEPFSTFEIRFSDDAEVEEPTLVSPDLATCADCERELFDPENRRFRYPFINCTNCGPRFTIIDELPYDRANTSMRDFAMCQACEKEYNDPSDRRFHAQPNACFDCGPELWLKTESSTISSGEDVINEAVSMLLDGKILAVKGLGGYHLVCDANNENAVARLRERKQRDGKPFAVMMRTIEDVRQVCSVNDEEAAILSGSIRPIVLLQRFGDRHGRVAGDPTMSVPAGSQATLPCLSPWGHVAQGLPELGVMLPYTPLQHLLLHDFDILYQLNQLNAANHPSALVMTSGNLHDEPIVIKDTEAIEKLGTIADAILGNNREILTRFDDSVVRVIKAGAEGSAVQMIRRARGFAPAPLSLNPKTFSQLSSTEEEDGASTASNSQAREDASAPSTTTIFAAGPEQKNTFAFLRNMEAFVSQHIGDMENADTFEAWLATKSHFERMFDLHATALACDLHPEYITTKWAHEKAALAKPPLPLTEVQHHHAHVATVIGENAIEEAVCGIAFDGTGYGVDGNIWGGEVLIANARNFERFANFAYVPMPGGAAAVKRPLQMAYGVLAEFDLLEHPGAQKALAELGEAQCQTLATMIEEGINTPVTSSVGRLFDAASALLGICTAPTYEGEPAIMLEAALWEGASLDATLLGQTHQGRKRPHHVCPSGVGSDPVMSVPAGSPEGSPESSPYEVAIVKNTATQTSTAQNTSVFLFDAAPTFDALLTDFAAGVPTSIIARRFHDAFVTAIVQAAQLAEALYGITTVGLSGGVFMNRYIIENSLQALEQAGFTAAINRELPPNDGCVSFGEAVVTYAKALSKANSNTSKTTPSPFGESAGQGADEASKTSETTPSPNGGASE